MAYHSGCGGRQLGGSAAPTLLLSDKTDTIRQISIDYSEKLTYTGFRTNVCVYKGVRIMKDKKEKFTKLLDKLTSSQIEYLYHLACKLFGHAPD